MHVFVTYIYTYMYVCMHVCILIVYVCMHVCGYINMHVCMYVRMYICMYMFPLYIYSLYLVMENSVCDWLWENSPRMHKDKN